MYTSVCCTNVCLLQCCHCNSVFVAGGSTIEDRLFDWNTVGSNYGPCVDIFAPATGVTAADYTCRDCSTQVAGTSYAVPIVSGLVAILLEKEPQLSPTKVMQRIKALCTRNALQFPNQQKQDGTPNCLAYIARKEGCENTTCGTGKTADDLTHNGDNNQTSDSKGPSNIDDQRSDSTSDTDNDGSPGASTEVSLVPTSVPVRNREPDYVTRLSIPASDLQHVLTERMNDKYLPIYISSNKEPSTGCVFSFIVIFKKTPVARDCKLVVNRRPSETRNTIKEARRNGYIVTLFHSYLVKGRRGLRFLAVLEPNETAVNFTSLLQYRVRRNAVESVMRKLSKIGYTINSMAVAFCDRVRPVFTWLAISEEFGAERHSDPPTSRSVLQLDVEVDQVMNTILRFRQNGYYVRDINSGCGCGNDTTHTEVKHGLLFHQMNGPFSDYSLKLFHSSTPAKKVEDSLPILGKLYGAMPIMAFNTGMHYIVQFKSLS